MAQITRATKALEEAGIGFELRSYPYDPAAGSIGLAAAHALGVEPGQVFKTLMVMADGKPACAIAPSDGEVSLKRVAAALGAKGAVMMRPADAERITGYKVGGISPLGQTRRVPAVLDETALIWDAIFVNGGQRGLQMMVSGEALAQVLDAVIADIGTAT